jgi:hypothetical protein
MITIFRVQDQDGRGPWKPGFSHKWVITRPDHDNLLPWPIEFGDILKNFLPAENHGCGCRTIKQLRRWFTHREYKTLKKFNYHAVSIDVDRIIAESNIQLVFGRIKNLNEDIKIIKLY